MLSSTKPTLTMANTTFSSPLLLFCLGLLTSSLLLQVLPQATAFTSLTLSTTTRSGTTQRPSSWCCRRRRRHDRNSCPILMASSRSTTASHNNDPDQNDSDDDYVPQYGVSFIGGDPCGSKLNDDPHDAQIQKPGMPDDMKARIQALTEERKRKEQASKEDEN